MKIWCLFEQSGTFKNEFKKFGFEAYDVDILNDFQQTDYVADIFQSLDTEGDYLKEWKINNERRIQQGHEPIVYQQFLDYKSPTNKTATIFDKIHADDLVFAFFPCTRFQTQAPLLSRGESYSQRGWDDGKKLDYSLKITSEMLHNYTHFVNLFKIAREKGFKMVVENPYSKPKFLRDYFPIKPSVVIKNRADYGDLCRKPTQFFFVNFAPSNNFELKSEGGSVKLSINKVRGADGIDRKTRRSMIHPVFANRFIREFILTKEQLNER